MNINRNEDDKLNMGSDGIRTHAPEETGALNQRLGPLGHATPVNSISFVTLVRVLNIQTVPDKSL